MYRRRKLSGSLSFSLSAADSGKNSPVFESFSVSNGIRQLASISGLVPAANEIAALSPSATDATKTCAMMQRHNDDARIAPPRAPILPPGISGIARTNGYYPTDPQRNPSNIAKTLGNPVEESLAPPVFVVTLPVCHTDPGPEVAKPALADFSGGGPLRWRPRV